MTWADTGVQTPELVESDEVRFGIRLSAGDVFRAYKYGKG